jgi:hypothetical protein
MKSFILKGVVILTFAIPCSEALAATPSRGLVIYSDIPSTYAETLEFVTITSTNAVIETVVLPNGKRQEIPRGGIIAIINYPPAAPAESLPQDAATALRSIEALRPKYPQFAAKLDAAQTKWNNSLEVYRQQQLRLTKATLAAPAKSLILDVEGVRYEQVSLTSFDGATVGIAHSAGVAGISAIKLKPEQIVALNATSTTVRIDSTKIVAATPAAPKAATPVLKADDVHRPVAPADISPWGILHYLEKEGYKIASTESAPQRWLLVRDPNMIASVTARGADVSIFECHSMLAFFKSHANADYDILREAYGSLMNALLPLDVLDKESKLSSAAMGAADRGLRSKDKVYKEVIPYPMWRIEIKVDKANGTVGFIVEPK